MGAVPVAYLSPPSRVVNEAVDMLGQSGKIIGDISDGTPVAEAARRYYGQGLRQLLRTANWDFARKRADLTLLGDATGNAVDPVSSFVESPWSYAYAWPIDAVQGRWLPWTPVSAQPTTDTGVPLTTGTSPLAQYPLSPGRFLVASSDQYPIETGTVPWDQQPDLQRTEGLGPVNRKVILTDCANAQFVYTRLVPVIEEWDSLFRQAFVTMIALALAPTAIDDPKVLLAEVARLSMTLKNAVADARVANGNESGYPQSTDHLPAWITARNQGWWGAYSGTGGSIYSGYTYYPGDASMQWCGSVY
jgi:hypothetical protein